MLTAVIVYGLCHLLAWKWMIQCGCRLQEVCISALEEDLIHAHKALIRFSQYTLYLI